MTLVVLKVLKLVTQYYQSSHLHLHQKVYVFSILDNTFLFKSESDFNDYDIQLSVILRYNYR